MRSAEIVNEKVEARVGMGDSDVWKRHDLGQMAGAEALTEACRCQQITLERPERIPTSEIMG